MRRRIPQAPPGVRQPRPPVPVGRTLLVRFLLRRIMRRGTPDRRQAVHRKPAASRLTVTPKTPSTPALRASEPRMAFTPALKGVAVAKIKGRSRSRECYGCAVTPGLERARSSTGRRCTQRRLWPSETGPAPVNSYTMWDIGWRTSYRVATKVPSRLPRRLVDAPLKVHRGSSPRMSPPSTTATLTPLPTVPPRGQPRPIGEQPVRKTPRRFGEAGRIGGGGDCRAGKHGQLIAVGGLLSLFGTLTRRRKATLLLSALGAPLARPACSHPVPRSARAAVCHRSRGRTPILRRLARSWPSRTVRALLLHPAPPTPRRFPCSPRTALRRTAARTEATRR